MATITNNIFKTPTAKTIKKVPVKNALLKRYLAYADTKDKEGILPYMKVVILIPCVFMVFSIIAMAAITPNYVWFVGLTILLFYANIGAHIAGAKARVFIPIYHATITIMILVPLIAFLISL